jgi:hypothetical protein
MVYFGLEIMLCKVTILLSKLMFWFKICDFAKFILKDKQRNPEKE